MIRPIGHSVDNFVPFCAQVKKQILLELSHLAVQLSEAPEATLITNLNLSEPGELLEGPDGHTGSSAISYWL